MKPTVALHLGGMLGIGGEQAALRLGILVGTIAPLLALLCHWIMKRKTGTDGISVQGRSIVE